MARILAAANKRSLGKSPKWSSFAVKRTNIRSFRCVQPTDVLDGGDGEHLLSGAVPVFTEQQDPRSGEQSVPKSLGFRVEALGVSQWDQHGGRRGLKVR
jgi:hypothetical protein